MILCNMKPVAREKLMCAGSSVIEKSPECAPIPHSAIVKVKIIQQSKNIYPNYTLRPIRCNLKYSYSRGFRV